MKLYTSLQETENKIAKDYQLTLFKIYLDYINSMNERKPDLRIPDLVIENYLSNGRIDSILTIQATIYSNIVFDVVDSKNNKTIMSIQEVLTAKGSFIDSVKRYDKEVMITIHTFDFDTYHPKGMKQFKRTNTSLKDLFDRYQ